MRRHTVRWNRLIACAVAGVLPVGCQYLPAQVLPAGREGESLTAAAGGSFTQGAPIISDAGAALAGVVTSPPIALIGNNSASLGADVGGGAFFRLPARILSIAQRPVSGAVVSFRSLAGELLSSARVVSDDAGRFQVSLLPQTGFPILVVASFEGAGKRFAFSTLLAPQASGGATISIDLPSTLASRKAEVLARRGRLPQDAAAPDRFGALVARVREALTDELVPFMAEDSQDVVAGFDQIALDHPAVGAMAAAIAPALATPAQAWRVDRFLDGKDLENLGIYSSDQPNSSRAGNFAVDKTGNLYFPAFAPETTSPGGTTVLGPIRIFRVTPSRQVTEFATVPAGYENPVALNLDPSGTLHVAAIAATAAIAVGGEDPSERQIKLFKGTGTLEPLPGSFVIRSNRAKLALGRLAIDSAGDTYLSVPDREIVMRLKAGDPQGKVFIGQLDTPGYRDGLGTDSLLDRPEGLGIGPDGSLYLAEAGNRCIRRIVTAGVEAGRTVTVAGRPQDVTPRNGRGAHARFGEPAMLAVGPAGDIFVSDRSSARVRRISRDGSVFLVAGTGETGNQDGPGHLATFQNPRFLTMDGSGSLYVRDRDPLANTDIIRKISLDPGSL